MLCGHSAFGIKCCELVPGPGHQADKGPEEDLQGCWLGSSLQGAAQCWFAGVAGLGSMEK